MKSQPSHSLTSDPRGFTLISAIVSIAVLAVAATIGFKSYQGFQGTMRTNKLNSDVSNLNAALRVYEANGGKLDTVVDPQAVVDRLKTRVGSPQRERMVGLRDSMTDPRLVAVIQTEAEAATDQTRAVWNSETHRFVVTNEGAAGVKKFILDDRLAAVPSATDSRETSVKYAATSTWVWDYTDQNTTTTSSPTNFAVGGSSPYTITPNTASTDPLNKPILSVAPGTYPLADYGFSVTLADPNSPEFSDLFYSVDDGDWFLYQGETIEVSPGTKIAARAVSIHPDAWRDSPLESGTYLTTPVEPQLALRFPKTEVTYAEVGGQLINASPTPLAPGSVTLVNTDAIPPAYQSDSIFTVHWTYDGSSPESSNTRTNSAPFAGGFPEQEVDYPLSRWGNSTSLPINVVAVSHDSTLVTNSAVVATTLQAKVTPLGSPRITELILGGGSQAVTIELDTNAGDIPVGARIFYTTDGTDPGVDSAGRPTGGTLYSGTFDVDVTSDTKIVARVYGPENYSRWFEPSAAQVSSPIQPNIGFTMGVSTSAP